MASSVAPCHTQFWKNLSQDKPPGVSGGHALWLSAKSVNIYCQPLMLRIHSVILSPSLLWVMDFVCWARNTMCNVKTMKNFLGLNVRVALGSHVRTKGTLCTCTVGQKSTTVLQEHHPSCLCGIRRDIGSWFLLKGFVRNQVQEVGLSQYCTKWAKWWFEFLWTRTAVRIMNVVEFHYPVGFHLLSTKQNWGCFDVKCH